MEHRQDTNRLALSAKDIGSLRAEIAQMYSEPGTEMGLIRGAHLNAVVRLTPHTMLANAASGTLVLWSYRDAISTLMWLWWACLILLTLGTLASWFHGRQRQITSASARAVKRATWHAATLALLWGSLALGWFSSASAGQQIIIATLYTGMLGAGSFVLNPLPRASLVYSSIYMLCAFGAMLQIASATMAGVAILLGFYGPMVMVGALYSWRKSTALLKATAHAERQEQMLAVLLQDFEQHADEALWEADNEGRVHNPSPRLLELLQLNPVLLASTPLPQLLHTHDPAGAQTLEQALQQAHPFRNVALRLSLERGVRHLVLNGKRLLNLQGQATGWRGVVADVTAKVESEQRLQFLAHTDSLTGLANRFTLREHLTAALNRQDSGALLMIDLDHFKAVNDSWGHTAGDDLLKAVAGRLRGCLRPGDLAARLGGDEFAILLQHPADGAQAEMVANRLQALLSNPIALGERNMRVGASVGGAVWAGSGCSVDELLVQADTALYAAKAAGRGHYAQYEASMGERSRRRLMIEHGLAPALEQGQFALHWQPKVDIQTQRIVGAEALLRWDHPALGTLSPTEFIGIAEQSGKIDALGRWALQEACRCGALLTQLEPLEKLGSGLTIAVNVSPLQFRGGNLAVLVRQALADSGLQAHRLELEITESAFMDDADGVLQQLHALRSLGVRIALDDFGTGYSSLAYLRRFPFDTLKIDQSFVQEALNRTDAKAIIQMISQLAKALSMRTVAEGVETAAQLELVTSAGCHEIQGFLVAQALPLPEFQALVRTHAAGLQWVAA
ncbi:MAG: PAS domain S-box protein [Burkholderiales bacterium PBB3]|nr:MAG: PAS domain S-box protein [Burkholderiales bacterium PBB3]